LIHQVNKMSNASCPTSVFLRCVDLIRQNYPEINSEFLNKQKLACHYVAPEALATEGNVGYLSLFKLMINFNDEKNKNKIETWKTCCNCLKQLNDFMVTNDPRPFYEDEYEDEYENKKTQSICESYLENTKSVQNLDLIELESNLEYSDSDEDNDDDCKNKNSESGTNIISDNNNNESEKNINNNDGLGILILPGVPSSDDFDFL